MERTASRKTPAALPGASDLTADLTAGLAVALLRAPLAFFDGLVSWQGQAEERAQLRKLSDAQLRDIGLSRGEAERMARKASWSRCV